MFRHSGKTRTLSHNLKIASILSFVAGLVNVTGFLSVRRLTTNVTGHFAFFVDEVFRLDFLQALLFFCYILFFFLGSFVSNFLVEFISRKNERYIYVVPTIIEIVILFTVGLIGEKIVALHPNTIACSLLFAMGLQNSLVTTISNAVVRTTHLTGLFTDLGIELSQLFFYGKKEQKHKLLASMHLRFTIIVFFFAGGIFAGIIYSYISVHTLIVGAGTLLLGLVYDDIKFRLIRLKRRVL